jgi:hypothetical protein
MLITMNEELWKAIKDKVKGYTDENEMGETTLIAIGVFIENGDNASDDYSRGKAAIGLKALFSTMDSTPFDGRKPDSKAVKDGLKELGEALTAALEHEGLFRIVEVPHGKTGKAAFESGEDWVQSRLKIYRRRLLAAHKAGNL